MRCGKPDKVEAAITRLEAVKAAACGREQACALSPLSQAGRLS
jgi:hypothetical protein